LTGVNRKVNITTADVLIEGSWTVLAIVSNGESLFREYMSTLPDKDRKKVWALIERTSAHGPPSNLEKYRQLNADVQELKSHHVRLPCFFDGAGRIVITHGWTKKKNETVRVTSPEPLD